MKRDRGLISLLYRENRFEDLEEENVFSIASTVDLFYFNETLFILSKKEFEHGLNFKEGMISRFNEMYDEVRQLNLFVNMDVLTNRVGDNQRYLRKNCDHQKLEAIIAILTFYSECSKSVG